MKKIKKGGKENEADYFYTADEFFLRKGYQIPDLVTEVRKEAYVSGFNRGQEQAYYGFWNKNCQKLFKFVNNVIWDARFLNLCIPVFYSVFSLKFLLRQCLICKSNFTNWK